MNELGAAGHFGFLSLVSDFGSVNTFHLAPLWHLKRCTSYRVIVESRFDKTMDPPNLVKDPADYHWKQRKGRRPLHPRSPPFICEELFNSWRELQLFYFTVLAIDWFLIRQSNMYMIPATSGGRANVKMIDASAFPWRRANIGKLTVRMRPIKRSSKPPSTAFRLARIWSNPKKRPEIARSNSIRTKVRPWLIPEATPNEIQEAAHKLEMRRAPLAINLSESIGSLIEHLSLPSSLPRWFAFLMKAIDVIRNSSLRLGCIFCPLQGPAFLGKSLRYYHGLERKRIVGLSL